MCRSGSINQINIPQTSSGGGVASGTLLDSMPNNAAITGKRRSSRPATATVYAGRLHNSGPSTHSTCLHLSEGTMALVGYGYSTPALTLATLLYGDLFPLSWLGGQPEGSKDNRRRRRLPSLSPELQGHQRDMCQPMCVHGGIYHAIGRLHTVSYGTPLRASGAFESAATSVL